MSDRAAALISGRWSGKVDLSRKVGSAGAYEIDTDLVYFGTRFRVSVLSGFATDGASVPKLMRWWVDPYSGRYVAAAIIHDGLYAAQVTTRLDADGVFLEAMRDCGVRWSQAWLMYLAVRLLGGRSWTSKTADGITAARLRVSVWRRA